jgi:hypothetical protein
LRSNGKWTRITRIEYETKQITVYNFEVEGNHSYFVGELGILSHNCAFTKAWASMTKAERGAFQHAISRHGKELGLPDFVESNADALMNQFNSIIKHIKSNGTMVGVQKVLYGERGSGISNQMVDAYVYNFTDQAGKVYYLYERVSDGRFISAGLAR